jgi:hypothetical protein
MDLMLNMKDISKDTLQMQNKMKKTHIFAKEYNTIQRPIW